MNRVSFPKQFPNSTKDPFWATSPQTPIYNCIAWAFGDNTRWYWPDPKNTYYWPPEIPRVITLNAFIQLYKLVGYSECENGLHEDGYEKIAIFCDSNGSPTHAARQLKNGLWTSKLGGHIDVSHTIESMEGGDYGNVSQFMKRK